MTAAELRRFFAAARSRGSRPGLSRIAGLLARCGDPQKTLRFVHVAGTNGKGSTAAMLSSILTAAGLRTGRFTSPCVFDFFEQIAVDGAPVPRRTLSAAAETLAAAAASMDDPPTEFELLTAAALLCFAREGCDLAVLEAGLGGAEDATNVIPAPEVAVFTRVGLDHTALLGDSVEQIARAKSGILKPGCSAVCWPGGAAEAVFARAAAEKGVPLTAADFSSLVSRRADLSGQRFDLGPRKDLFLPLLGEHQLGNAAVAAAAADALAARGFPVTDDAVRRGLAAVRWPGRFEVLRAGGPAVILDGGHNPQGAEALADALRRYLPGRPVTLLTGVLADKDYAGVYRTVAPLCARFVATAPPNPRALSAGELARLLAGTGKPVFAEATAAGAARRALALTGPGDALVVFGSLYLLGPVRRALDKLL